VKRRDFALRTLPALTAFGLVACGQQAAEAAPGGPTPSPVAKEAYELAASGHGFTTGPVMAANTVYVFFDTTCPHCAHLWQAAKPLVGKLKIVWMPVGYLRPQSTTQGATILSAASPADKMEENEKSVLARLAGITPSATLSPEVLAQIKTNTKILSDLKSEAVPVIVYRNAKTGQYGKVEGALDTEQLSSLVGL
jgi:thiol:disulfide interchange protein DsbG